MLKMVLKNTTIISDEIYDFLMPKVGPVGRMRLSKAIDSARGMVLRFVWNIYISD